MVVFLEIHPFQDGNGRLSRVLTTLLLLQAGYAYVPYSSLESVIEQNKEAYYLALRQTQARSAPRRRTGNRGWCSFSARWPSRFADWRRRSSAKSRAGVLAGAVTADRRIRARARPSHHRRAIRLTGASRNTLKQHFRALVERGTLNHTAGPGVWYDLR